MSNATKFPDYSEMQDALEALQRPARDHRIPCPHPECSGVLVRRDGALACVEHDI